MSSSSALASFASRLKFDDIPVQVVRDTEDLFFDWLGSALAGSQAKPVQQLLEFSRQMGPQTGGSFVFCEQFWTSPYFAALINGASSHVVEQDDLHNQSILHPATVVFPPLLALAQSGNGEKQWSGKDFITAAVAGYECGIRVGEFLGPKHYRVFHMTATAGTVASAMAVSNLLGLDENQTLHALGSAGTQAGGLWQFLDDAADSKQLHTAKACADGMLAAQLAAKGFTGAQAILEGRKGMAAGMMGEGDETKLTAGLGQRWATSETSFKYHASCRHTHPAADALLHIRESEGFVFDQISCVKAYVYQAAKDVLGQVDIPQSIHQSKFSMGFVLALLARHGRASVADFTEDSIRDEVNLDFLRKVEMIVDPDINDAYPGKWTARVEIQMQDGQSLTHYLDTPKGDPCNRLSRQELEQKFRFLMAHFKILSTDQTERMMGLAWGVTELENFNGQFSIG